ncbi:MAG: chorismate mutase [Asticcacaulis sp.]
MTAPVETAETLDSLRQKIDALDHQLLQLTDQRSLLAHAIAAAKVREAVSTDVSLLRPDREALLLRKLLNAPRKAVSDAAVVALWRELISESLRIQGEDRGGLHLNFCAKDTTANLMEWARERFGIAPSQGVLPEVTDVIAAARHPSHIGILSLEAKTGPWWARLLAEPKVRIICALPEMDQNRPRAVAIAPIAPEPTGNDISFFVTDSAKSETAIIDTLSHQGLAADWLVSTGGLKLFALIGFVQEHDSRLKDFTGLSGIIGTSPKIV